MPALVPRLVVESQAAASRARAVGGPAAVAGDPLLRLVSESDSRAAVRASVRDRLNTEAKKCG
jgi:hypothetical protein